MNNLFRKLVAALPYVLGALAIACAIGAYVVIKNARADANQYLPMMRASLEWPAVPGEIVGQSVYESVSGRLSHSPVTHYTAEPEYTYAVAGTQYRSIRVCPFPANCGAGTEREHAEALLAQYPVGSQVDVYYDPAAPEISVLRRATDADIAAMEGDVRTGWYLGIGLAVAALVLGFVVVRTAKEFQGEE